MRTIVGYEGEGRDRRAVWSDNVPTFAAHAHRPKGSLVVGRSTAEQHRASQRNHKARKAATA